MLTYKLESMHCQTQRQHHTLAECADTPWVVSQLMMPDIEVRVWGSLPTTIVLGSQMQGHSGQAGTLPPAPPVVSQAAYRK